jgi:hypothetical protein
MLRAVFSRALDPQKGESHMMMVLFLNSLHYTGKQNGSGKDQHQPQGPHLPAESKLYRQHVHGYCYASTEPSLGQLPPEDKTKHG